MKEYHIFKKIEKMLKIRAASVKTQTVMLCIPTEPRIGKQTYIKDISKILC